MTRKEPSQLERLFQTGSNPVHLSVTFCLLWIAAADGVVDDDERLLITQAGGTAGSSAEQARLLALVRARDVESLIAACVILSAALTDRGRLAFLTLVIEVAVTDGRLSISENHLCRFFADLLGVTPEGLKALYLGTTGSELPDPGDPSSITWWEAWARQRQQGRETSGAAGQDQRHQRDQERESGHDRTSNRSGRMTAAEAYVVLGLRPGATPDEITKAYRRAVQAHHPDRFAELGPDAQRAAHEMFVRIQHAYKVLS